MNQQLPSKQVFSLELQAQAQQTNSLPQDSLALKIQPRLTQPNQQSDSLALKHPKTRKHHLPKTTQLSQQDHHSLVLLLQEVIKLKISQQVAHFSGKLNQIQELLLRKMIKPKLPKLKVVSNLS